MFADKHTQGDTMTNTVLKSDIKVGNAVAKSLQAMLVDTYGLFLATHNYHWNVEGPHFASLHQLFEAQYNELFIAIDDIAERIRALGDYALPFEGSEIVGQLKNISNPLLKEKGADKRAHMMIENLLTMNDNVIKAAQNTKKAAQNNDDNETEDMMIARIQVHQKTAWMLNALIQ